MNEYENMSGVRSVPTNDFLRKEIARDQRVHVDLDKVRPLNGRFVIMSNHGRPKVVFYHDVSYGRISDENTKLLEFAAHSSITPIPVFTGNAINEASDRFYNSPATGAFEPYVTPCFSEPRLVCFRNDDCDEVIDVVIAKFAEAKKFGSLFWGRHDSSSSDTVAQHLSLKLEQTHI